MEEYKLQIAETIIFIIGFLITAKSVFRFRYLPKPRSEKRVGFHNLLPLTVDKLKHASKELTRESA